MTECGKFEAVTGDSKPVAVLPKTGFWVWEMLTQVLGYSENDVTFSLT